LQPSASKGVDSFDRLHPQIRRWIREQGWQELRDVQDRTIQAILGGDTDVLIAASTASGKTEAAFLPVLTRVADRTAPGVSVLYVSPLKALINDQFRRLDMLCERMEIPITRWHGDAPQGAKTRILRAPRGLILITPESVEALLLRRSADAEKLLGSLDFVVIDELHAFLQGPRGLQLASLLSRIELLGGVRPRRIGLSATIGDLALAASWLNPASPGSVAIIESSADGPELRLQVRGYVREPTEAGPDDLEIEGEPPKALDRIADHAFEILRGSNNLFFAGSRRSVEALADRFRRRAEAANVPNEFFPHHGSLSKELREELELRLKKGDAPTTAVATTTLELGVDIGSVKSVALLGPPRSLSSLRQRLGRSGRRQGAPAVLRVYVREPHLASDLDPLERLRPDIVQTVAAVRLLLDHFVEPPGLDPAVVSVALHQTLSMIAQRGGARADSLYRSLRSAGPFAEIYSPDYAELLRWMARPEVALLEQAPDGLIMLGEAGERLVAGRDFYAVFESDEEWRLSNGGRTLGVIPLSNVITVGSLLAFAGQRWRVVAVDDRAKVLEVTRHRSGRLPKFDRRSVEPIHDRLAAEMRAVYQSADVPPYLDAVARQLLEEGRQNFVEAQLAVRRYVNAGGDTHVMTWRGFAMNSVLAVLLTAAGLECEAHDLGVTVANATDNEVMGVLGNLTTTPSAQDLSEFVGNLRTAKYDAFAPEPLLRRMWTKTHASACARLPQLIKELS